MLKQNLGSSRKVFNHQFVNEHELTTEMIDNKRYYLTSDGQKFKSVTTILSERTDKTALLEWRKRIGDDMADRIMQQASVRGNAVHNLCERYLRNYDDYIGNEGPVNVYNFKNLQSILDDHVDNLLGIELPLFSPLLKAAGRTDLVAHYDDRLSIIDFKTSKKLKKEEWIQNYFIQATTYSLMFEELYGIKVPQLVIMITVDHEEPQIFIKKTKDYYSQVHDIFVLKAD